MMDRYEYTALPHQRAIRLLKLEPGKVGQTLVGSMRTVDIDRTPPYDAISYVWGNPERKAQILCDGHILGLTSSLDGALQRVRCVDEARLLWADAICIDQSNVDERSEQVQLMRYIYQQATEVLVWLGPEDKDGGGEEVFRFLRELWEESSHSKIANLKPLIKSNLLEISESFRQHSLQTFPSTDSPLWYLIHCFYRQSWFTRVWVIQEVAVSTSALIMYGKEEISWPKLGLASVLVLHKALQVDPGAESGYEEHFYNSVSNTSIIWDCSLANPTRTSGKDLLELLFDTRNFAATDPRDKIYALLGLADALPHSGTNDHVESIMPDYRVSYHHVYRSVVIANIMKTRKLDILAAVEHKSPTFDEFPSWVPVWNRAQQASSLGSAVRSHYKASEGYPFIPRNSSDEDCLIAQGLVCDTISQLTAVMNPEEFYPRERAQEPTAAFHPWIDSMSRTQLYPTGESPEVAYSLTLVANATRGMAPAHEVLPQHLADFSAYLYDYFKIGMPEKYISRELHAAAKDGDGASFAVAARNMCNGRRFFITSKGYTGIGPAALRQHDLVCVLFGGRTPFVLKKEEDSYRFLGEAYVHGLMNGEAIKKLEEGELSAKSFRLR